MIRSPAGADIEGPYRYRLWREWNGSLPSCLFVMLNPSTADASQDDPTIRRCIGFAKRWGFGRLDVVNLYALRATDPRELRKHASPIGPRNDLAVGEAMLECRSIVAAWGARGEPTHAARMLDHAPKWRDVFCLGVTLGGAPLHPLYVAGNTVPVVFKARLREPQYPALETDPNPKR